MQTWDISTTRRDSILVLAASQTPAHTQLSHLRIPVGLTRIYGDAAATVA
jgi:hypothetical protein